jgi:hypothetical protein
MSNEIAIRKLLVAPAMTEAKLVVTAPTEEADGTWVCRVEFHGLSRQTPVVGFGEDGMQAIKLAIQNADAWLLTMPEYKGNNLLHSDGSIYE